MTTGQTGKVKATNPSNRMGPWVSFMNSGTPNRSTITNTMNNATQKLMLKCRRVMIFPLFSKPRYGERRLELRIEAAVIDDDVLHDQRHSECAVEHFLVASERVEIP